MTGFFTVCNRYQLPEAIALGKSIRTHHSNARFVIGYADDRVKDNLPEGFELIRAETLGLPFLEEMSQRYQDFEFVHALRPWFAKHLFEQAGEGAEWAFLAPTTLVCRPLDDLPRPDRDFLLTANILQPLPYNRTLDDKRILNIGMFNSNAWIARNTATVRNLLTWWAKRTTDRAFFDLCNGMCLDQLWLNYVPVHVPSWGIIRHETWHLGLHNTANLTFSLTSQLPAINGKLFYTIDFSGLHGYHPVWSDHTSLAREPGWRIILRNYQSLLENYEAFRVEGQARYGKPVRVPALRNFRRAVKSELDQIITFIDKVEI